ncbi:Interaptin like [Actinidia chinensis var. chinensis]|uniref:Interaptin like n=1 Tax=Actinidia chinensis var. chinensis TaxID=1590841 RepID=A0A2R6RSH0_ACTCC|nr:Interaptin like [Actinidia chinensis var. chinensis]
MEAAASVAAARSVPFPMQPSHLSRKEWRVVSEQSVRNASSEDMDRLKLGQSDERTIYEVQHGREPVDVDFCSITIDGSSDNDILQQRLHSVGRQREDLQQIEIELRAQIIARSEIMELQNNYDKQIKEHANANVKLQERLHEMEQTINELERKMEEKDRELHAIKLDNEAAWAKEDLLREQNKELQSFRRERDNTEAERAQHVKQIHDFQEHFQEKERHLLELQEQHRVAQENILFKDEQLRDAQAWITRVQEMDAFQSTTNHSLQAELQERTEQYNQLWLGCQRQFAEMERLHLHTVQQLQLELADAREKCGTYPDESHVSQTISKGASQIGQNNGNQLDANGSSIPVANSGSLPNESPENVSSFVSAGNGSAQADHPHGVPIAPSSLLGMPTYLPAGQVTALHPYVMHQHGVPHSIPSQVAQSHVGQVHSEPALSPLQHWQNQQASSEGSQVPTQNHYPPSQTDQNLLRSDTNFDYEVSVNGQSSRSEYLDIHLSQGVEPEAVIPPAADGGQLSVPNQHSNGVYLNAGGITNIKILSKPKDLLELNGTEIRPGQSSGLVAVGNGANLERSGSSLSKGSTHVRPSVNFVGKQQGRTTVLASNSRR